MRRLVIPLLFGFLLTLTGGQAFGQIDSSVTDTLGFYGSPIKQLQGEIVELPVYLSTDSIVQAVSMNFTFDPAILGPVLMYDEDYQALLDSQALDPFYDIPDSNEYVPAGSGSDSGLWYIEVRMASSVATTFPVTGSSSKGVLLVPYNLNDRGVSRLFLSPNPTISGTLPYIPPGNRVIAYIKFRVTGELYEYSDLDIPRESDEYHYTELTQMWFSEGSGQPIIDTTWTCTATNPGTQECIDSAVLSVDTMYQNDTLTVAVFPTRLEALFTVDTPDDTGTTPTDENELPVMGTISPSSYDVEVGQLVSFSVSASDVEEGEVSIYANRTSSLPSNASLYPSNPIVGSGGSASGTFSFTPGTDQAGQTFAFTFEALDDSGSYSTNDQTVVVNVAGLVQDVLYTTSAEDQSPEGGVPGLDGVLVPINIVTEKTIYGIQFDMTYDANKFDLDSIVPSDRIPDWATYDNIGTNPGEVRVVTFGLANDQMVEGSSSAVLYLAFKVDEYADIGCYPLSIFNAIESVDPDPEVPSLDLESEGGILCVDMLGDVNLNFELEVDDLTGVVGYIIRNYDLSRRRFAIADVIINDTVNVVDLVGIVNMIFGIETIPAKAAVTEDEYAELNLLYELVAPGYEGEANVEANMPVNVAGVELKISYNPSAVEMLTPEKTDVGDDFVLRYKDDKSGNMKVLLYSTHPWNNSDLIPTGLSEIIKLPYVARDNISLSGQPFQITEAFVSTGQAKSVSVVGVSEPTNLPDKIALYQNRPNPFNPSTVIDFAIDNSGTAGLENVKLQIYNILGQNVTTLIDEPLPTGQYSVTWDGTDDNGSAVASGVYLYRLKIGEASKTKKMMLLK